MKKKKMKNQIDIKKYPRGRPETIKLSERERYLDKEDFERFVTLRSDYTDGKFDSKDPEYKEYNRLKTKDENKKKEE